MDEKSATKGECFSRAWRIKARSDDVRKTDNKPKKD
jgi:hypothetical protein